MSEHYVLRFCKGADNKHVYYKGWDIKRIELTRSRHNAHIFPSRKYASQLLSMIIHDLVEHNYHSFTVVTVDTANLIT